MRSVKTKNKKTYPYIDINFIARSLGFVRLHCGAQGEVDKPLYPPKLVTRERVSKPVMNTSYIMAREGQSTITERHTAGMGNMERESHQHETVIWR